MLLFLFSNIPHPITSLPFLFFCYHTFTSIKLAFHGWAGWPAATAVGRWKRKLKKPHATEDERPETPPSPLFTSIPESPPLFPHHVTNLDDESRTDPNRRAGQGEIYSNSGRSTAETTNDGEMVSISKENAVYWSVGAATLGALSFYLLAPRAQEATKNAASKATRGGVGIYNQRGSDCFINSVIQALAGLPSLRRYLQAEARRRDHSSLLYTTFIQSAMKDPEFSKTYQRNLKGLDSSFMVRELNSMIDMVTGRVKLQPSQEAVSNASFRRAFEAVYQLYIGGSQQDAHEFAQFIMDRLLDEYNFGRHARRRALQLRNTLVKGNPSLSRDQLSVAVPDNLSRAAFLDEVCGEAPPLEPVNFPFYGMTELSVICSRCKYESEPTRDFFSILHLTVPPRGRKVDIKTLISNYFSDEKLDDYLCYNCKLGHLQMVVLSLLESESRQEEKEKLESVLKQINDNTCPDPETRFKKVQDLVRGQDLTLSTARTIQKALNIRILTQVVRSTRLAAPPQILVTQINRSVYEGQGYKDTTPVMFDDVLEVSPASPTVLTRLAEQNKPTLKKHSYRLKSAIMHSGGHEYGHYVNYRQKSSDPGAADDDTGPSPESWFESDFMRPAFEQALSDRDRNQASVTAAPSPPERAGSGAENETDKSRSNSIRRLKSRRGITKSASPDWWKISDAVVKSVPFSKVVDPSEVYMLFFELEPDEPAQKGRSGGRSKKSKF